MAEPIQESLPMNQHPSRFCAARRSVPIGVFLWAIASFAIADHWPNWRGPDHNGISRETELPAAWNEQEGVFWKSPLPEWGNSTPVIWDDAIFLTCHVDDRDLLLLKLDRTSGTIDWTRKVGTASTPRGTSGVTGQAARGQQKFHATQNLASPSCTVDGDVVIAHFGSGDLAAYDFAGKRLWHRNLQEDYGRYTIWWGHANSPVLHGDAVISVCMQDSLVDLGKTPAPSYVVAHHKRTGQLLWHTPRPTSAMSEPCDSYTTPVLQPTGDGVEMILFGGLVLDAYDPDNGQRLWQLSGFAGNRVIPNPVVSGDQVYLTQGMRHPLVAVRRGVSGQLDDKPALWSYDRGTSDSPTPVVYQDLLFFVTNDGFATALDTQTGDAVWRERLPGQYRASPLAAAGRIYFLNVNGLTTVVEASREFRKIAENKLDDETLASPVSAAGHLYIRTRQALYCLGSHP
jgi:outer membrane protein assembly factor BamB